MYSIQIFVRGEKIKQNRKRTSEKIVCSFAIHLQQMNATG